MLIIFMTIIQVIKFDDNETVKSFVSRCSHLRCRSRHFDSLQLVFIEQWGRLLTRYHLYLSDLMRLADFDPHCSGEFWFSVV